MSRKEEVISALLLEVGKFSRILIESSPIEGATIHIDASLEEISMQARVNGYVIATYSEKLG